MAHCQPCVEPCDVPDYADCLDLLWPKLEKLRDCFCEELSLSLGGEVCRCMIVAGSQPAWDNCCNGTAWLLVDSVYPSTSFPNPDGNRVRCDHYGMAANITFGVVRCAPTVDDLGDPPTPEMEEQAARVMHSDRVRMMKAVRCCFTEDDCDDIVFGQWVPLGPQGGCVGGQMEVAISFNTFGCECECDGENVVQP